MNYLFKLPITKTPKFPNECFVCGKPANRLYKVKRFQFKEFYIFIVKYSRAMVEVPICSEHYNKIKYLKFGMWLVLAMGLISAIFINNGSYLGIFCLVLLIVLGKKYFAMINAFRIYSIDGDGNVVYSSNRENYILKLCELNDTNIFLRNFSTGIDY